MLETAKTYNELRRSYLAGMSGPRPGGVELDLWHPLYMDAETIGLFKSLLDDERTTEKDVQRFIEERPYILPCLPGCASIGGSSILPQKRLGSEYVPDFLLAVWASSYYKWTAIELESPKGKLFTKKGDPTSGLSHAIRQIQNWRAWINRNTSYACRPKEQGGLGLPDISSSVPGLIVMGRRDSTKPDTLELRQQMIRDLNIDIHSYDYLLEEMAAALDGGLFMMKLLEKMDAERSRCAEGD